MKNTKPIIIFVGPSGVGKGTIEKTLFGFKELNLQFSVSMTTRMPREGEINGSHYFFTSKEDFLDKIKNNKLIEYSYHFDNYYGTLYSEIDRIHANNGVPFLEIETNGAKLILANEQNKKYQIITFFILPPSLEELEKRIVGRKTEDVNSIKKRLQKAQEEISEKDLFKYHIINEDPVHAAKEIRDIILNELKD